MQRTLSECKFWYWNLDPGLKCAEFISMIHTVINKTETSHHYILIALPNVHLETAVGIVMKKLQLFVVIQWLNFLTGFSRKFTASSTTRMILSSSHILVMVETPIIVAERFTTCGINQSPSVLFDWAYLSVLCISSNWSSSSHCPYIHRWQRALFICDSANEKGP